MIRLAKENLLLETDDFLPHVDKDLAERGVSVAGLSSSTGDEVLDDTSAEMDLTSSRSWTPGAPERTQPARARRVSSSVTDHFAVAPESVSASTGPIPAASYTAGGTTGTGLWMRIVGNLLLGFVAVIWVLLLIGAIDNPDDLGGAIGGGAASTFVPFLLGLVLRRAGKRRATTV